MNKISKRLFYNTIANKSFYLLSIFSCILLASFLILLLWKSYPIIQKYSLFKLLTTSDWRPNSGFFGFFPFIVSTFWTTFIAIILALPVCLLTSIYLMEYASRRTKGLIMPIIDILSGIPSVIFGIWGVIAIVPFIEKFAAILHINTQGYSILAGGIVLSVMVIPILVNIFCEVIATIPKEYREATLSLGATKWETIKKVVIKKARAGLFAAIILAFSRALGETIAVLMVVGNSPVTPKSIFDMGYPIPALIANNYGEMMSIPIFESALMFAAFILFIIILIFNIIGRIILNKLGNQ